MPQPKTPPDEGIVQYIRDLPSKVERFARGAMDMLSGYFGGQNAVPKNPIMNSRPPRPVLTDFDKQYLQNALDKKKARDYDKADDYSGYVYKEAPKYGLTPLGVLATIAQESNFNPKARGTYGGELGLMQIHPRVALAMGLDTARLTSDPLYNIRSGMRLMSDNRKNKAIAGNEEREYQAYNYGSSRVAKGKVPPVVVKYGKEVAARKRILAQREYDKKYGEPSDK